MKNFQVQRFFYPVGHGAFYVETFHDCKGKFFTFVYDCGSSNKNLIKKCIEDAVNKGDFIKINALFISHFDEDHVNGLEYLQTYMDSNTKVFIPFYYNNYLTLYSLEQQDAIKLILSVLNKLNIVPIYVQYNTGIKSAVHNIKTMLSEEEEHNKIINSGDKIRVYSPSNPSQAIWEYIPFNLHNEKEIFQKFKKEVVKSAEKIDLKNPSSWTSNQRTTLRRIYKQKSMLYEINENSLLSLSHSLVYVDFVRLSQGCTCLFKIVKKVHFHLIHYVNGSCLYTGDCRLIPNSKIYKMFVSRIQKTVKHIELLQIPHHGSSNNSNIDILKDNLFCFYFVSYCISDKQYKSFPRYISLPIESVLHITEESPKVEEFICIST